MARAEHVNPRPREAMERVRDLLVSYTKRNKPAANVHA